MPARRDLVFQFKVVLKNTKPPIWRRIQLAGDGSFWDLHVAIQDAMGWEDAHLHEFEIMDPRRREPVRIGIPDPEGRDEQVVLAGWKIPYARYFGASVKRARYCYDFGDGWDHELILEKTLPREADAILPRCLAGRRACPLEDCGGPFGYDHLLRILDDPDDEQHAERMEWVGGPIDPEAFSIQDIVFDDPAARLQGMLGGR